MIRETKSENPSQAQINTLLECYQEGRYSDAKKLAVSMTQEFPKYQFGWKVLGALLKQKGKINDALFANRKSVQLSFQDAEAHNNLGNTLKELGRLDEAITSYKQAIDFKPDFAEAYSNLGVTLQELGRLDEAEISYKKAIELNHNYFEAHYNLGVLLFTLRKYNLALKHFELCHTHQSKLYEIQCSFMVDEKKVFYEKFDLLLSQGETNAVIGSLGFRSEFKYGIQKFNTFCNDPLDYVVKTDLSKQYDFEKIFIETTKDVLADSSVPYKSQGLLTNGVQTSGNIFTHQKIQKAEIESIIRSEVEKFRTQFKDSKEGFIKNWPVSYKINGWLVCMRSGGKLDPHMHDNGWITGSIYINMPPKSKIDNGNLVLCLSEKGYIPGVEKKHHKIIDVVTASLCLFPSSLHHYTIPFEEKEERIVLAFDIIPFSRKT